MTTPAGSGRPRNPVAVGFLVLAIVLTAIWAVPRIAGLASPAPEPGSTSPVRPARVPASTSARAEIDQDVFADPGSAAARAYASALSLAEADAARLDGLAGVSVVGSQRTLECNQHATGGDAWKSCLVVAFHYAAWDGDFTTGHDTLIAGLSDPCSFAETAQFDWTPPADNARQQQGGCPGRPNVSVHWSVGSFGNTIRGCSGALHDACGPVSSRIAELLDDYDWQGRVWFRYPLDEDTWSRGAAGRQPTAAPDTGRDGRPAAAQVLDGDDSASARKEAVDQADRDAAALSRLYGVTLAGSQRTLSCSEGRDFRGRQDATIRLTCAVRSTHYLTWSGDFAKGRRTVIDSLSDTCAWQDSTFDWRPRSEHGFTQQQAECPETRFMYVDWARPANPDLVHPCLPDLHHACTPNSERIVAELKGRDWAARVSIAYRFYQDKV